MKVKNVKNILVATNHLVEIGGSELYTYYLIKAIAGREGVTVDYFTREKGLVSDKVENELNVGFMSRKRYDLILANHHTTVRELYGRGPIIQICHGIVPGLEHPSPWAHFHVAISEEVSRHLRAKGYRNKVILNGVDTTVFKPERPLNEELRSVLSLCQSDQANQMLRQLCEEAGLEFDWLDKNRNPEFDIADRINKADLVVGIGRSVYDAMACGRACIVYDYRHYNGNRGDGYLFPGRFDEFVRYNCSGRFSNKEFEKDDLLNELKHYRPDDGPKLRTIALERLDAGKMAGELLNLAGIIDRGTRFRTWWRYQTNPRHKL